MNSSLYGSIVCHFANVIKSIEAESRTKEAAMKRAAYEDFAKFIRKEAAKGSIQTILEVEQCILAKDLTVATDQREVDSLRAGIQCMDAAISSLPNVENYPNFSYYLKGCGLKNLD